MLSLGKLISSSLPSAALIFISIQLRINANHVVLMLCKVAFHVSFFELNILETECVCPPGFSKDPATRFKFLFSCIACPSGQAPT